MDKTTPLNRLASAICGRHIYSLFPNQTIMYQIFVVFSGNMLYNPTYFSTTDALLPIVKKYLYDLYSEKITGNYSNMHKCICETITSLPSDHENFNDSFGHNLSYLSLAGNPNIRTNINKVIKNTRSLSLSWINECQRNYDNIDVLIKRMFWMLQYFCVYYSKPNPVIVRSLYANPNTEYTEFFSLSIEQKTYLLSALKENCLIFSPFLESISPESLGFHVISRIAFDAIKAHYELSNHAPLSVLPEYTPSNKIADYASQLNEFQFYIDAFGQKTLDRFNILHKYAPTNFFAANELGNLYFYGETMIFSGNNEYIIKPDYKKAIYYYSLSISNSNPPYPVACWSLGYILQAGYCSDEDKPYENIEKAKHYFSLAGNYPPAINSLAKITLNETDRISHTLSNSEKAHRYAVALNMAYRAAQYDWFYGHNIIAQFIIKHQNEKELLDSIRTDIEFPDEFDAISQLKSSCEYNNPWALHALAMEYLKIGKREDAKAQLEKACALNYNRAYYTLATTFYSEKMQEKYLQISSVNGFSIATYELAKMHETDISLCLSLLDKAEQQNLSLVFVNKDLQKKIADLRNKINQQYILI